MSYANIQTYQVLYNSTDDFSNALNWKEIKIPVTVLTPAEITALTTFLNTDRVRLASLSNYVCILNETGLSVDAIVNFTKAPNSIITENNTTNIYKWLNDIGCQNLDFVASPISGSNSYIYLVLDQNTYIKYQVISKGSGNYDIIIGGTYQNGSLVNSDSLSNYYIGYISGNNNTSHIVLPIFDESFETCYTLDIIIGSSYNTISNNARVIFNNVDTSPAIAPIFIENYTPPTPPSEDPYDGVGDSGTGGGDGTFDGSSDPVDFPNLPSLSAVNTGFISLFVPTQAQLQQVANYMWSSLFDVSTFFKLFEDPMDCILGLSVVPVSVPTSGNAQITVGNIELSGITLPLASQQYVEVDCGSISFANKYFGSYLDYEPYTKMAIFLPYCGTHQINADDIMGKTVHVKYHIDILTGSCVAFVKCGDSVLYEYNGACASNIPVNSINYASTIENAIRIAVNIGTTVATAGASAPLTGATEAMSTAQNIGRGISLAGSTAEGALSMKPNISRSGALGGSVGILGNQTPYIIITRPRLCKPKNQDLFEGYPSFIQTTIGDLVGKGYTSFTDVIISSQYLTDAEEQELEGILKGGVYL